MHELFLLIYRQPLHRIIFWTLILAFLWGYVAFREKNSLRWRLANGILFAGIVAVIFYMTVYTRGESATEAILIPFQSFQEAKIQPELYRSMLMNVFLFVPVGLSLPFVLDKRWLSIVVTVFGAFLCSASIEYLQYRFALGRCEVDDVIMNTLGAAVGCLAYCLFLNWECLVLPGFRLLVEVIHRVVKKLQKS